MEDAPNLLAPTSEPEGDPAAARPSIIVHPPTSTDVAASRAALVETLAQLIIADAQRLQQGGSHED